MHKLVLLAALLSLSTGQASEENIRDCVQGCLRADNVAAQSYCPKHYSDRRPHPLLVNACKSAWTAGGASGCQRACRAVSCAGFRMSHDLLDQRDEYCRPMERQMPRPTVLEVCREAFLQGAETMCQQVESAVERALHEQAAREQQHMGNLELAVEQSSFGEAGGVAFDVVEAEAAEEPSQDDAAAVTAPEEPAAEASAAAAAAAPAVPEIALRGSAEEVVAASAPAAPAPAE